MPWRNSVDYSGRPWMDWRAPRTVHGLSPVLHSSIPRCGWLGPQARRVWKQLGGAPKKFSEGPGWALPRTEFSGRGGGFGRPARQKRAARGGPVGRPETRLGRSAGASIGAGAGGPSGLRYAGRRGRRYAVRPGPPRPPSFLSYPLPWTRRAETAVPALRGQGISPAVRTGISPATAAVRTGSHPPQRRRRPVPDVGTGLGVPGGQARARCLMREVSSCTWS